jgi:hypothetical protein
MTFVRVRIEFINARLYYYMNVASDLTDLSFSRPVSCL